MTDAGVPAWAMSEEGPTRAVHSAHPARQQQDPEELVAGLNPAQREAVLHHGGPLLIIAGAGSGKTTLMAARVVYLVVTGRVRPDQVLGLTFTSKAASELRSRVREALVTAGVLDADLGLAHGDPRAAEKTFQILTQVTGRAGRAGGPGRRGLHR